MTAVQMHKPVLLSTGRRSKPSCIKHGAVFGLSTGRFARRAVGIVC